MVVYLCLPSRVTQYYGMNGSVVNMIVQSIGALLVCYNMPAP